MADSEFKKFATFTSLITPQLITISYWLLNLVIVGIGTFLWTMPSMVGAGSGAHWF